MSKQSGSKDPQTVTHRVSRWESSLIKNPKDDWIAVEEPLEIRIDSRPISITMRTPGADSELAAGFLFNEGLIHRKEDIEEIAHHPKNRFGNVINLFLKPDIVLNFKKLDRSGPVASSCGLCGKTTIDSIRIKFPPIKTDLEIEAERIPEMATSLRERQSAFDQTGGLHAAAVFDSNGEMTVIREDIGRHNAVDKVIGFGLLQGLIPYNRHVLVVSGRTSFEIVQKALAAGISIIAGISAPSSLAIEFAEENDQTLIGFLKKDKMNLYTVQERIRIHS
ncbi:MAG TPA: formate dehydrogenase accessory sulfurtransferase FdhD [Verrucomicrobiales bacterium]|nr:formate dehydrogenase accessory sulfurtransferase FdhD [Verrucomicrobiales bacterium]HIL72359.1 formate dehydrogenase accessory sulfurtransferase FdhD [Verrucomicrobiota bacterium]